MTWVSAKFLNVLLYPFERLSLIFQTVVQAKASVGSYLRGCKESVRPDSVIEVDYDHVIVASFDEVCSIVIRIAVCIEASTLDKDVDGQAAFFRSFLRCKDIDEQAVF
jgi:hypothetical protein